MIRGTLIAAVSVLIAGAAFVTGKSAPPPRDEQAVKVWVGQRTAYFNMAAVMRGYKKAKDGMDSLSAEKTRHGANLAGMRAMHSELRKAAEADENLESEVVRIGHLILQQERDTEKILNDRASAIISELYDEIHAAVREIAREGGIGAVMAYPDAVSDDERANPYLKELKLKPPAAMPFYLDPSLDCTAQVIERINRK